MALHPFDELAPEFRQLLSTVDVQVDGPAAREAQRRLDHLVEYQAAVGDLGIPLPLVMALHVRESSGRFDANLCNGDPLTAPTVHVPKGRPPGANFPVTWAEAARDALTFDRLNVASAPWSLAYACWKAEAYNGFGPRGHGIHSGYLWAGTQHYRGGKYVADHVWRQDAVDQQLGAVPIMLAIGELAPELKFGPPEQWNGTSTIVTVPVGPAPLAVGGNSRAVVLLVQTSLNMIQTDREPLVQDGSFGRLTRAAVFEFEKSHGLTADGLLDRETIDAIAKEAAALKIPH